MRDYYRYTGDRAFARQEFPIVQRELAWNASQLNGQLRGQCRPVDLAA